MTPHIVEQMHGTRTVAASALESSPELLDGYPYRYLHVTAPELGHLVWCVEALLEPRGWDVQTWLTVPLPVTMSMGYSGGGGCDFSIVARKADQP